MMCGTLFRMTLRLVRRQVFSRYRDPLLNLSGSPEDNRHPETEIRHLTYFEIWSGFDSHTVLEPRLPDRFDSHTVLAPRLSAGFHSHTDLEPRLPGRFNFP